MKRFLPQAVSLLCLAQTALCNVEKTIFLGPDPAPIPLTHPTLDDLHIDTLTPDNWSLRTLLTAKFPTDHHPKGYSTWLILDNLQPSQRYEVRICWAATQPTSFRLDTHTFDTVFSTPNLITSLNDYSLTRQPSTPSEKTASIKGERHASTLFLHILAAADYHTTNATLMKNPSPVLVDIILDPFLFNIIPRSLLPTIGVIIVVAITSYFIAQWVVTQLNALVAASTSIKKTQ
ncbi:hypothetical protein OQA88_12388 [Cercophora sp. LCS_1]